MGDVVVRIPDAMYATVRHVSLIEGRSIRATFADAIASYLACAEPLDREQSE
jgi:hypothetical protein